jgi:phospholipase C
MKAHVYKPHGTDLGAAVAAFILPLLMSGCALFYGSDRSTAPSVAVSASPVAIAAGGSSTLVVTALNATQITVTGSDGTTFTLPASGGMQTVNPSKTTQYTATADGKTGSSATANATVVVSTGNISSINHVVFLLQENHSFDNYFGMLNPYRKTNGLNIGDDGVDYEVDGIDDKLTKISNQDDEGATFQPFKFKSTCIDDESSDWLASFGDVNRYDFSAARKILMDGFVHNAEGYAKACSQPGAGGICAGTFSDLTGQRSIGYYDQDFLNYYYYMASQFAISDRWFSPVASKSVDNRIATFTGGTTQGIVKDPGGDDHLPQLDIPTIFQALDQAKVSWKVYYIATQGLCAAGQPCTGSPNAAYPATDFANLLYSKNFFYANSGGGACNAPTQPSSVVGDTSNSFCIDPTHVTPIATYFTDVANGTLPSFAFIEAGYGFSDEHPGSGQSILVGQNEVASLMNSLMQSSSWYDSVFFFAYDEGGGPYDHVPPVPGHSNDYTDSSIQSADISAISVSPDNYRPCVPAPPGTPTIHCDLAPNDPGATATDAAAVQGFGAQLGFRVPNFIISPYVRKHYVSHVPMDHTAVIRFVENRFLGGAPLTARDAVQPDLSDFFDFNKIPWLTPPAPPAPVSKSSLGYDPCTPGNLGP